MANTTRNDTNLSDTQCEIESGSIGTLLEALSSPKEMQPDSVLLCNDSLNYYDFEMIVQSTTGVFTSK